MKHLALAVLLFACDSKKDASTQGSSYTLADYAREGIPATDHDWSLAEHTHAAELFGKIVDGHRDRLPRYHKGSSSAVFDHMIAVGTFNDAQPIGQRLAQHLGRFQAAIGISKLYNRDGLEVPNTEWIELMSVALHEASAMTRLVDPFIASLPPDDPQREARLAGIKKMRTGWSGMLQGGLLVADNNLVAERDRVRLLKAIEEAMPVIYPTLATEDQKGVRDLATRLAGGASGPISDGAARIAKLASSPPR